jgi:hypothetical protein
MRELKKKAGQRRRYGYTVNDATRKRCTMKTTGVKKKSRRGFVRGKRWKKGRMYGGEVISVDRIDGVVGLVGLLA